MARNSIKQDVQRARWAALLALGLGVGLSACGPESGDVGGTGGVVTPAGGAVGTGGIVSAGGAVGTGGLIAVGGVSTGGAAVGGAAAGGASTGGAFGDGGAATGGAATGGVDGIGGAAGGGGAVGGSASGGGGGGDPVTCPAQSLNPGNTTRNLTVGGKSRSYILHIPNAYDGTKASPFIVDFHPLGGSGQAESSGSPYPSKVDAEGVIMAFPSGLSGPSGNAWNVEGCCVSVNDPPDDVAFARALVDDVKSVACVDPERIYAVGFSMGGGMTHYLGCHASDIFAAIAPAAFDLLEQNIDGCQPTRPLTVVAFRGTNDNIVPYAGGHSAVVSGMAIDFLGAEKTRDEWARMNGCTGAVSAADGKGCTTYSTCEAGTTVTLCTNGNGHAAGDASIAWPILKQHKLHP